MSLKLVENAASELNRIREDVSLKRPSVIKQQCLTCNRWIDGADIIFGYCAYCLEDRAHNAIHSFNPIDTTRQQFPRCFECNSEIYLVGMKTWDALAKSFKVLCTKCGEKQVSTDRQYRETPWGRENKLK